MVVLRWNPYHTLTVKLWTFKCHTGLKYDFRVNKIDLFFVLVVLFNYYILNSNVCLYLIWLVLVSRCSFVYWGTLQGTHIMMPLSTCCCYWLHSIVIICGPSSSPASGTPSWCPIAFAYIPSSLLTSQCPSLMSCHHQLCPVILTCILIYTHLSSSPAPYCPWLSLVITIASIPSSSPTCCCLHLCFITCILFLWPASHPPCLCLSHLSPFIICEIYRIS